MPGWRHEDCQHWLTRQTAPGQLDPLHTCPPAQVMHLEDSVQRVVLGDVPAADQALGERRLRRRQLAGHRQ